MSRRLCSVPGCARPHRAKGYCKMHWQRLNRGYALGAAASRYEVTSFDRFIRQVSPDETGCWIWTGAMKGRDRNYGHFRVSGRMVAAHRWSYEFFVGPIPDGLTIDHLCRNPPCVNPDHLEPVTTQENIRRRYATVTHCKRGHDLTDPRNYRLTRLNGRDCRLCARVRDARRRAARRNADEDDRRISQERADEKAAAGMPKGMAS